MRAFSKVPPPKQELEEKIYYRVPFEKIIEVQAIDQTKKIKQSKHLIINPNNNVRIQDSNKQKQLKTTFLATQNKQITTKDIQKNIAQPSTIQLLESVQNKPSPQQHQSKSGVFQCLDVGQQREEQQIMGKSPIKKLFESRPLNEQTQKMEDKQNNTMGEYLYIDSHIKIVESKQSQQSFWHKKPIFQQEIGQNSQIPNRPSIKTIDEFQIKSKNPNQKDQQNNYQNWIANQPYGQPEIQCTLFSNSIQQNQAKSYIKTDATHYSHKNNQSGTGDWINLESSHKSDTKELYESYYKNKDKFKKIGGKRNKKQKTSSKTNEQIIQITAIPCISINPVSF